MAMSEEERRRLQDLEQELASSDPDLVRKLQGSPSGKHHREAATMVRGILTLVAGFMLVIVGIATELVVAGAGGFVLMIAGAHWFLNGYRFHDGHHDSLQT
jgi:Protein of unknown function (DUF3040)